jgi:uncharacterized Ntn-hydrolase superfamily protein
MTFSIVARDLQTNELGIAVQSKFLAVGAVVPWARAGTGAIATQSWANTSYGPRGYDNVTRDALRKFSGRENLEERWFEDTRIDRVVLDFIRRRLNE